jgi:hypothetical protein
MRISYGLALAGFGASLVMIPTPTGVAADYDAAYVGMTVPNPVRAGDVFAVTVTMRNMGTQPWEGWPIRLRTINPTNHTVWGTDYILIAQGSVVPPGSNYVFRSNLRAPRETGPASFQWQVCQDATLWFGETTPSRTLEVLARPPAAGTRISAARNPDGPAVLHSTDLEYVGSFKPPKTVGEARGAFSECGVVLRPMPDGRDRLFMNYTHPAQVLFEVEIPPLVKIENGQHAALNTAALKKIWGGLSLTPPGESTLSPNGGFVWDEGSHTLIWTWYHGYKTGEAPPLLGATTLSEDGTKTSFGPWRVVTPAGGLYKSYWGGVLRLSSEFASQYTGGRTLALGFGGYYSICASASRGPALGVVPEPDPGQTSVSVTPLLHYPDASPAPRDGDYFNANCGFWNQQPRDFNHGTWTYDDYCRAGVWIETPSAHGYLAFVRVGTGRLGYDFGSITDTARAEYWYWYDPKELGEAAAGRRSPWQTMPVSMTKVRYPLGLTVTGACFDPRTQLVYVCVSWAYPDGRESYPIVHVYRVGPVPASANAPVEVRWSEGILESSASLPGSWDPVLNAASPYRPDAALAEVQRYYRVRQ